MVGGNVDHIHHRDLYSAARQSRRNGLITIWCRSVSGAETLVGILKRVIVSPAIYPHFLEFLHVDVQGIGRTLSRPWSRQMNDVMSEIECGQLHSELFRFRHSTRQSHGLFALAKHLLNLGWWLSYSTKHLLQVSPHDRYCLSAPLNSLDTLAL